MRWVTRLYPRRWRQRYGQEFEALLDSVPLSPAFLFDIVRAATTSRARTALGDGGAPDQDAASRTQRLGACAAILGGSLWASTFVVGALVDWGRNGRDWGFLLLVGATGILLVHHVIAAWRAVRAGHPLPAAGLVVSVVGLLVLGAAVVTAAAMEQPLAVRPAVPPLQLWGAGMLLSIVGAAIVGLMAVLDSRRSGVFGTLATATTLPLAGGLMVALDAPSSSAIRDANGQIVAMSSSVSADAGWFTTSMLVVVPGILFGIAWVGVGIDRLRAGGWSGAIGERHDLD